MQDFEILLQEFEKIPKLKETTPTIIEIAGFPHYENVCSNILAYYFNTNNPHGLKNLLLKSLLDCARKDLSQKILDTIDVRREEMTPNQKRIDIAIESEDSIIIIENKIYADLYNDLHEYANHMQAMYAGKINQLKIVLSLNKAFEGNHSSGFINVTYLDFVQCIKSNLGDYMISADSKASIFLLDFLQTIQNLTKPETMNPSILDFFIRNKSAINNLLEEHNSLQNHVANKVSQLRSIILPPATNVRQWVYKRHDLVHDFDFNGVVIAVDCVFDIDGIEILVWVRKGNINSYEYLKRISPYIGAAYSETDFTNNRLTVISKEDLPFSSSLEQVKEKLNFVLENVSMTEVIPLV